jgi:predicted ATPase/class 3 adenylate cyclase
VPDDFERPTGTITFLFSDIVGSTRLWAADREAMSSALLVHNRLLETVITDHGGHVFSNAGDSYGVAFGRASAAVDCAAEIQRALAAADWGTLPPLKVRIGLHMGEAEEREDNYFGPAVNQAARVMGVAHGGQCVLTDVVRDAADAEVTELGVHTLRDIDHPVHLSQLGEAEFPPLWSLGVGTVSLPSPRTSLIGRDTAVDHVRRLLGSHSLVTLTGVGGCGKTRLAVEVAYREVPTHQDGVWFVDLSTIADDVALPGAFATGLRLTVSPGVDPMEQVASYLSERESLLVVDNCEHVVDAAADTLDGLLARAPRLRILATSRESLEIEGEYTWKVPSLPTGSDSPAAQLFFDRAVCAGADLSDDERSREAISTIADRLDGIPLAIELAAARARSMDLQELAANLDDRFRLLSGGARRARQRQATLEGAVQWSYDLLEDEERAMLQALSVFQGGFAVADAAAIAGVAVHVAADLIDGLAAKSLVDVARDPTDHLRHRLLETVRLFALSRLIDSGNATALRDRHMQHFANDPGGASFERWTSLECVERLGREYENFRTATSWALESGHTSTAVHLAAMLSEASSSRGEIQLAMQCLGLDADLEPQVLIFARSMLAWAHIVQGNMDDSAETIRIALEVHAAHPCDFGVFAIEVEASRIGTLGRVVESRALFDRAVDIAQHYGLNTRLTAATFLVTYLSSIRRFEDAARLCDELLAVSPEYGYRHVLEAYQAWTLLHTVGAEAAQRVVESFGTPPSASRWTYMAPCIRNLVLGHVDGPDLAAKRLTAEMQEEVSRRPQIVGDVLTCFAYLAWLRGEPEHMEEILESVINFGMGPVGWLLICESLGAPAGGEEDVVERWHREHPFAQRLERSVVRSPQLLAQEYARWT